MIKAIIFDFFGVVVSDGLSNVIAQREKADPTTRKFIEAAIKRNNRGLQLPDETNKLIGDRLGISAEDWRREIHSSEERNTEVINLILELRAKYKTALLSNVGKGSLERRFSHAELKELFDVVVASAEVGVVKPNPEIYQLTAERLGVQPSECVFIDDRQIHVAGAHQIGMSAILYKDFAQIKRELDKILES